MEKIWSTIKKFFKLTLIYGLLIIVVGFGGYLLFARYASYSDGFRVGQVIKFSRKGKIIKTWEGEISQGISGAQIFKFSVEDNKTEIIKKLEKYQGRYVKLKYKERVAKVSWLGDTKYFIIDVIEEASPHFRSK